MRPSAKRFALLTGLAWELRAVPATSVLVLPAYGETVLWMVGTGGRKEAVLAVRHPVLPARDEEATVGSEIRREHWSLLWRGAELNPEALPEAARLIAAGAAG